MRACIDSDVLIWHLRGETRARDLLCQLQREGTFDPMPEIQVLPTREV